MAPMSAVCSIAVVAVIVSADASANAGPPSKQRPECQLVDAVLDAPLTHASTAVRTLECVRRAYRRGLLVVRAFVEPGKGRPGKARRLLAPGQSCAKRYVGEDPRWYLAEDRVWMIELTFRDFAPERLWYLLRLSQFPTSDPQADRVAASCGAQGEGTLTRKSGTWSVDGPPKVR